PANVMDFWVEDERVYVLDRSAESKTPFLRVYDLGVGAFEALQLRGKDLTVPRGPNPISLTGFDSERGGRVMAVALERAGMIQFIDLATLETLVEPSVDSAFETDLREVNDVTGGGLTVLPHKRVDLPLDAGEQVGEGVVPLTYV